MKIAMPEHNKAAYLADFLVYGFTILGLTLLLVFAAPQEQGKTLLALSLIGLGSWTLLEYFIHRLILHGVQPFQAWHAEHHRRPVALIRTPTILSASLILILVFLPVLVFSNNLWRSCALTLGLLMGYFMYTITHHAIHHWHINNAWLKRRQNWHGMHHDHDEPGRYGVTSNIWDRVFRTAGQASKKP